MVVPVRSDSEFQTVKTAGFAAWAYWVMKSVLELVTSFTLSDVPGRWSSKNRQSFVYRFSDSSMYWSRILRCPPDAFKSMSKPMPPA